MAYRRKTSNRSYIMLNAINLKPKIDVNIPETENFEFGEALESVYPLLDLVFGYLDFNDLNSAALVKKSWQIAAKRVLERRNKVTWISVSFKGNKGYVDTDPTYWDNNKTLGIITFNFCEVSRSDYLCIQEENDLNAMKFSDFLEEQVVPKETDYCIIGCSGCTGIVPQIKYSKSLFNGLFIPNIPNVRVSMCYYSAKQIKERHMRPNERLKCLLIFPLVDLRKAMYKMLDLILENQDFRNVAIGGGIIRNCQIQGPNSAAAETRNFDPTLMISFYEDVSTESIFDSSSVVICGDNLSSTDFEKELLNFKNRINIRHRSVAFRICCAAKHKKKHETEIFNNLFPNTPLLGLNAEGEIGWNCFNKSDNNDNECQNSKKPRKSYPIVQHQWSTVIVFITWGHLVK